MRKENHSNKMMKNMKPPTLKIFKKTIPAHLYDLTPGELKIYTLLCFLADENQRVLISSYNLSLRANLKWKVCMECLPLLKDKRLVKFEESTNPFLDMEIVICSFGLEMKSTDKFDDRDDNDKDIFLENDNRQRIDDESQLKNIPKRISPKQERQIEKPVRKDSFADIIAKELDDEENIGLYKNYCERYSHETIQKALEQTLSIPEEQIRKSRGALFNYLVQQFNKTNL